MNFMSSLKYWVRVKTHINKLYAKYDKFAIQNDSEKSKKTFSKPEKKSLPIWKNKLLQRILTTRSML